MSRTLRTILLSIGAVALFGVTAFAGYAFSQNIEESAAVGSVPEYGGMVVTSPSEDTSRRLAQEVITTERVKATGSTSESSDDASAETMPSGTIGGQSTRPDHSPQVTITDEEDGVVTIELTPDETEGDGTADEAAIPPDVLLTGPWSDYIDWDDVVVADVPTEFRFDICAGSNPFMDPIPGCPDGTGATILPLDDETDSPPGVRRYSVNWFANRDLLECVSEVGTLRIAVRASGPSEITVGAWNYRGSERPGERPTRLPEQEVVVRSTPEELTAWQAEGDGRDQYFCVEVDGLEPPSAWIDIHGRSIVPGEDLTDTDSSQFAVLSETSGVRPPTTLNIFEINTLNVRAYRKTSPEQQTFVQARRYGDQSCDNGGDMSLIDDNPDGIQGAFIGSGEVLTDRAGWTYDPAWDAFDIHQLVLPSGDLFLICVYWIESGGPSFAPDEVVLSEVMLAVAPDISLMTVSLDSIVFDDLGDDPRINQVTVLPTGLVDHGCRGLRKDTNSSVTDGYFYGPDQMCVVESPYPEYSREGFFVEVLATDSLGDTYRRTTFVRVDQDELTCPPSCTSMTRMVAVPLPFVPPREITGSFEWPVDVETGAIPPPPDDPADRGEHGPSVGSAVLELRFEPTGEDWWGLDTFREVDLTEPPLPARPQFEVNIAGRTTSSAPLAAISSFELLADRPVAVEAAIVTDDPACAPGPGQGSYTNSTLLERHTFAATLPCLWDSYVLQVTVRDDTGAAGVNVTSPSEEDTQLIPFGTVAYETSIVAEVTVNPDLVPEGSEDSHFHIRHAVQIDFVPMIPRTRSATPSLVPANSYGGESGWKYDLPYINRACDVTGTSMTTATVLAPLSLVVPSDQRNWPILVDESGIRVRFEWLEFGMGAPRHRPVSTHLEYNCDGAFVVDGRHSIDEVVSLEDLARGVDLVSEDGLITVHVSAPAAARYYPATP